LMTRSATASSKILGDDHPDDRSRCEQAALWLSMIGDKSEDGDCDDDVPVQSDYDGGVAVR
jgi:hypothetical protein